MDMSRGTSITEALARVTQSGVEISSIVNIGAGSGKDTAPVERFWRGAQTLLVEMDDRFVDGWRELRRSVVPDLKWEVCGAASEDRDGHMRKSNDVGGAIALVEDLDTKPVRFRTIDTLAREHQMRGPYFLRFDTHGVELDILAGARETLKHTSLIQMECYNFKLNFVQGKNLTFDEMVGHMRELGFRVLTMCDPLHRSDGALWQMHLFFVRADHKAFRSNSFNPTP